ncbi:MAG TPA: prenyltransferase/squalene oxidase repeat-containing protein, partial [Chloroflexota bacterium]
MRRSGSLALALGLLLASIAPFMAVAQARAPEAVALPAPDRAAAIGRAIDSLKSRQLPGGAFEGFTPGAADDFTTIKAVIAVAAAGRSSGTLTSAAGQSALGYLAARATAYTHAQSGAGPLFPGRAGQLAVAVVAGDGDPTAFGGMNLIAELQATYDAGSGAYATAAQEGFSSGAASTLNQLWSILGLAAAQQPVPSQASDFLISLQEKDGGWGFGSGGDVDTTALVVQALIASGNVAPDHARVQPGLAFLRQRQAASGGWASFDALSADSTAVAIQALAAAGYVPATATWLTATGRTPQDDLVGLQSADGSFGGNALGTADAIPGLAEAALPLYGRAGRARLALTWLAGQQNADGSWNGF